MASPFPRARAVRLIRSLLFAAIGATLAFTASAAETFKVRLRPVPIEASTAAATPGAGAATAELDGRRLKLTGDLIPALIEIRGEVFLSHREFARINGEREIAIWKSGVTL